MHDIDTALLRAFVAVVDTGNFSRAARRLNRTQFALSMQIKRLEDAVETVLFERSVRPPSITPAGELFVAYAREMLALNDAAIKTIKANKTAGQVRLALMEDYASTILAPVLTQFMAENQDVQVEVHTGLTNSFVDQLGVQFDLVIAMVPIGYNDGELLYSGKSVWGGAACFEPRTFDPLPLALNQQGCYFRRWAIASLDNAQRRWQMVLTSSSFGAVVATVREGCSLSVFKDNTLPGDLRQFGVEDGLPELPDFEIRMLRAPSARTGAAHSLASFLGAHFLGKPVVNHSSG